MSTTEAIATSRLRRALWNTAWRLLASWTPVPCHGWRRLLLRAFGARMAGRTKVYPSARIWDPRHLVMEADACLGPDVDCYNLATVTVGVGATVSQRSTLCAGTHDIDDPTFPLVTGPISVGANAWIAAEAFVGPGVTIGEGAVLGARGVATKALEPWTVYAGNPVRPLRKRRPHAG
jgi:putative colanic acid biosynthesis acetyltransferase WcaF